jgi:integrase
LSKPQRKSRGKNLLTPLLIETKKPADTEIGLNDGAGLSLVIRPDGYRRWLYRYSVHGKRGKLWLGYYPDVTLAEARRRRDDAAGQVDAGADPRVVRKVEKITKREAAEATFEILARAWWTAKKGRWTPDHADRVLNSLEVDVFPDLGPLPIAQVTAPLILGTVKRIEARGAFETAQRVLQRIGGVMRYAIANGKLEADPTYKLSEGLSAQRVEHRPAMPRSELPEYFKRLAAEPLHQLTRLALEFLALTFVRPGELRHALWSEIDEKGAEWRIPAERMKMRAPHIVPLSKQALAVLKEIKPLARRSDLIFPSQGNPEIPMSENTLSYALGRMGYAGIHCPHGFRSLASTILNEQGFNPDWIERQLAHAPRNKIRAAYNRAEHLPERRKMMNWWADFLDKQRPAPLARRRAAE